MKRILIVAFCGAGLLSACVDGSGGTLKTGNGFDTAQSGDARGSIARGANGNYIFSLTRDAGVCTAAFENPAFAGKTDLAQLRCTNGGRGTATVVYGADATPESVVYAVNGSGGGTIRF